MTRASKYFRILSIDGGGIRGLIPAQVIVALEAKLQKKCGDSARISDFFDLVAGTSTGGILACTYLCPDKESPTRPRFSATDAVDLYMKNGGEIFDIPVWHRIKSGSGALDEKYPSEGIKEVLRRHFGSLALSELLKPCLITAYDIRRRRSHFFTQHDAKISPSRDFLVRDVARATSAAPTFFECAQVHSLTHVPYPLIDGGVFANNPALCAYAEARTKGVRPTAKDMLIVSLGTGSSAKPYSYKSARSWGAIEWLKPVLDIMMSGVSETVDYQLRQIYEAVDAKDQYIRIQPNLPEDRSEMDNVAQDNLLGLLQVGADAAGAADQQLDVIVDKLLA